jgi:putative DNA primase/helicase
MVSETGVEPIESVNKALLRHLGGDGGTHDISRVLRVPGTFNFKLPNNPRKVANIWMDGPKYEFEDFQWLMEDQQKHDSQETAKKPLANSYTPNPANNQHIDQLPVSDKIKSLILNGNDGSYSSRSEVDQAVITALVSKGMGFSEIKQIFETHRIGEKYREHQSPDKYLQHNINTAQKHTNLTDEEMLNPLFLSGSLHKDANGKYHIDVVRFQEYMFKKLRLKYLEDENTFFSYNGRCYAVCKKDSLNYLCQDALGTYRALFTPQTLGSFIHYGIGSKLVSSQKAQEGQVRYLTLQNGLFDLNAFELVPHNPNIFTTNLLPYDYDLSAKCPRFEKYLREVFLNDMATITCVQETVGYAFYKSIPKPALFCLIGGGGNGKSVFIETLVNLFGTENSSSVSLNMLPQEYYLLDLLGKMINVSGETPSRKLLNTDLLKAVVAGDFVTARGPYGKPSKFKPFAKHFLAMNEAPVIEDSSYGMWRRLYIINFPRRFSEHEKDVHLTESLKTELSGIFNWALEGFKRLRNLEFRFEESSSMKESKQSYRDQSNSALSFAGECLEKSSQDESLRLKDVYEAYESYCEKEGFRSRMKKSQFRKSLEKAGYIIENSSRHNNDVRMIGVRLS